VLTGNSLRVKDYWNERENEGKRIDTLWNDLAQNTAGSGELEAVMGFPNAFDNPKPTDLVKRCLRIAQMGICFRFFCRSGTTAQAVLELNQEDLAIGGSSSVLTMKCPKKSRLLILWQKALLTNLREKALRKSLNGKKNGLP
jgi:hypothetical protein